MEEHIYHHYENDKPRVNVSVEKNTKGYNYSATVTGAATVAEAVAMLNEAIAQLRAQYES